MTVATFTAKFMIISNLSIAMMCINDALLQNTSCGYGCHVNRGWQKADRGKSGALVETQGLA